MEQILQKHKKQEKKTELMYSDPRKQSQIVPDHQNHVYNVYIDAQAHDLCHTNVMGADKAKIPGSWIEVFIIFAKNLVRT